MKISCPSCQKTYNVGAEHAGKNIRCACGKPIAIPKSESAIAAKVNQTNHPGASESQGTRTSTSAAPATNAQSISIRCSCGTTLRAPVTAAGKAIRCKCGKAVAVPSPSVARTGTKGAPTPSSSGPQSHQDAFVSPLYALDESHWKPKEVSKPVSAESKPKKKEVNPYLARAAEDINKGKSERKSSAGTELNQSRYILLGLGALNIVVSGILLYLVDQSLQEMANEEPEFISTLRSVLYIIHGTGIGIGVLFILLGIFVFLLPMTCTICAIILYVISQIISLVLYPGQIFSIRSWILKAAIFGGLIQAINNAAYYNYAKKSAKQS